MKFTHQLQKYIGSRLVNFFTDSQSVRKTAGQVPVEFLALFKKNFSDFLFYKFFKIGLSANLCEDLFLFLIIGHVMIFVKCLMKLGRNIH